MHQQPTTEAAPPIEIYFDRSVVSDEQIAAILDYLAAEYAAMSGDALAITPIEKGGQ